MKMAVFWDVEYLEVLTASIIKVHCPDDGGSKHLRNVAQLVPDYTV
jgi:hypothetical protein